MENCILVFDPLTITAMIGLVIVGFLGGIGIGVRA